MEGGVAEGEDATVAGYWVVADAAPLRMAFAGDVHGEAHIGVELRNGGNPLTEVAPVLQAADVAAVNLETPVGLPGIPQPKDFVFLAPEELLPALKAAGVDVVNMANNHAIDHGAAAMLRTISAAEGAGLVVVGAGIDADAAYRPKVVEVGTRRVAFVGLSRVFSSGWAATPFRAGVANGYDEEASLAAVRSARSMADTVVVMIHWGVELEQCPDPTTRQFAAELHAAGATVIAGSHPHVLQGVDSRSDQVTAYSLGNFVWYHNRPPSGTTGILQVEVETHGEVTSDLVPAEIGSDGHPRLLSGSAADAVRRGVDGGSSGCWVG